ncbi:MAG: HD-GYP domain-containing protein [Clostridia bacterium]
MYEMQLRPYADGPLYHHEALNGTGYPQGLTKKDIPYVAQLIRVADEYDAIVTKRQYKTHINTLGELRDLIKDAQPTEFLKTVALDMLKKTTVLVKSQ